MRTAPAPTLVFENAAGRLLADLASFLRVFWGLGPRSLAETSALFAAMTKALQQRKWSRILVYQVRMLAFTAQEQRWIAEEWLPQAVREGGYHHGAVVVSTDAYTRLATAFITTTGQGLSIRYRSFDKEEAAVAWLRQQPT